MLTGHEEPPVWAVFEHRAEGIRVERRIVATAGQAAASARLALSRAQLFQQAQQAGFTDGLTGVSNRRAFDAAIARWCEPSSESGLVLILADIDHFKSVNDHYGHQMGDTVLQAVAAALRSAIPAGGMIARFGGEEFAVVLPGADRESGAAIAEALRASVAALTHPLSITASFGVGVAFAGFAHPEALIADADSELYRAKADGRNRVSVQAVVPAPRSPQGRSSGRV